MWVWESVWVCGDVGVCMKRVAMLVVVLAAAAAWGKGPGDYYLGGSESPGIFSPFWRTITVFGSVNTNDALIFMDRTGAKVRGTNLIDQVQGWAAIGLTNEAALRAAGDVKGTNYTDYIFSQVPAQTTQVSVAQSGTAQVAVVANVALSVGPAVSNSFLRVYDSGGGVWKILLPGEVAP